MTNIRETIASDIETTLKKNSASSINLGKVVRSPVDISDLSRASFPIAVVTSADETREDITMGGPNITRQGVITYWIDLHVWGENRDQELNDLIDLVETKLDQDRTRNSAALDTVITTIRLLDPTSATPYTSCRVFVDVEYVYTRGNS